MSRLAKNTRNIAIYHDFYDKSMTQTTIAAKYKISAARVSQIILSFEAPKTRNCKQCETPFNIEFDRRGRRQLYCSKSCRVTSNRDRVTGSLI